MRCNLLLPLLAAAFLLFSSCAPAQNSTVSEPEKPEISQSTSAPQESEHLPDYDQFDYYNYSDECGFYLSEAECEGVLCYKLEHSESGVILYVPPQDKTSDSVSSGTLCYGGRTCPVDLPVFNLFTGLAGGISEFQVSDLTGDGTPEFIYIHGGSGTGLLHLTAEVYDLSSMTQCPVVVDYENISSLVTLTPVAIRPTDRFDGEELVYHVSGPNGQTGYAADYPPKDGMPVQAAPWFGNYESYRVEEGQLWISTGFLSDQASRFFNHLGFLTAPFTYDADSGSFSIQTPFTLTMSEPITYP